MWFIHIILCTFSNYFLLECRPEKHGHEFLNALSAIFNKCIDEASTPVACLAINGIITLCKSEVNLLILFLVIKICMKFVYLILDQLLISFLCFVVIF